jgi:hypothetical protein
MSEQRNSFSGEVCQHVRLNGARCTQPARRNSDFCRFHDAAMKPLPAAHNLNDQLPVLEDADSIQIAIIRLLRYLMKGPIDRKDIGTLLYGLQLASTNLARTNRLAKTAIALLPSKSAANANQTFPSPTQQRDEVAVGGES